MAGAESGLSGDMTPPPPVPMEPGSAVADGIDGAFGHRCSDDAVAAVHGRAGEGHERECAERAGVDDERVMSARADEVGDEGVFFAFGVERAEDGDGGHRFCASVRSFVGEANFSVETGWERA